MNPESDLNTRVAAFVREVCAGMGLDLQVTIEPQPDSVRIDLAGPGGEMLLRRKGEGLDALQHIVNTAFKHEQREARHFTIDCLGYRKNRDAELKQMARYLLDKAKQAGAPQEIGPLNPYQRRLVHLVVADDPEMTSESIGDAFLKTVIISRRKS
jgi:spoIIIJ-associated protein